MALSRRKFLSGMAAAAGLAPVTGFPAVVKLKNPNSLLSHACVGTGNMARGDLESLRTHKGTHITAICDVDENYLKAAHAVVPDARLYRDWYEMMETEGARIDSVNVSVPDHMHAPIAKHALRRGLNVYCQKPLCNNLADCRAIEELAAAKQAVTQLGTQIASWECDRQTVAFLESGVIGPVKHVWLFSNRRALTSRNYVACPTPAQVPPTLDWKRWLGVAPYRPYAPGVYHPFTWRQWRQFGTSWLGDMGSHIFSPVWIGMHLGRVAPTAVTATIPDDGWDAAQKREFWPRMVHVTWDFPGVKATAGKPFQVEWCDGSYDPKSGTTPEFLPPKEFNDLAAKTPLGKLPPQGRVVEGEEGWLISVHFDQPPAVVLKKGGTAPALPQVAKNVPSHYHQYLDCCINGGSPTSAFAWSARLTDVILLGNEAQLRPGKRLLWDGNVIKG